MHMATQYVVGVNNVEAYILPYNGKSHILSPRVDIDSSGKESLNCLHISSFSSSIKFCFSLNGKRNETGERVEMYDRSCLPRKVTTCL